MFADRQAFKIPLGEAWASNTVNTAIFRGHGILTRGHHQFTAFYLNKETLRVVRRDLTGGDLVVHDISGSFNIYDAHDSISLGCDRDGVLHLAYAHHATPLRYRRSTSPLDVTSWTDELPMTGEYESTVTYPGFLSLPAGKPLLFLYRDGKAARGALRMKQWSEADQRWTDHPQSILSGASQQPWTSNPYWNSPAVGEDGSIHLSFVWRAALLGEEKRINNINIDYAWSPDIGLTWYSSRRRRFELPITQVNSETIWPVSPGSNLINQTGMALDGFGRPHVVFYSDDPDGILQYQHLYFDGRTWKHSYLSARTEPFVLKGGGTLPIPISRPDILIDRENRVYVIYRGDLSGDRMVTQRLLPPDYAPNPSDIRVLWDQPLGFTEPVIDRSRWTRDNVLSMLVQRSHQPPLDNVPLEASSEPIWIADWDLPGLWREASAPEGDGGHLSRWLQEEAARSRELAARLLRRDAEIEDLTARLQQEEAHASELRARLTVSETEATGLSAELEELSARAADSFAKLEISRANVLELETKLKSRDAEAKKLATGLKQQEQRAEKWRTRAKKSERDLRHFKRTFSWRITAPLREVAKGLRTVERVFIRGLIRECRRVAIGLAKATPPVEEKSPENKIIRRLTADFDHVQERLFLEEQAIIYRGNKDRFGSIKVSIILPTFNRADMIAAAIDSVIAQSHQNWELIIVDDGSTDNTARVIKKFDTDSRIKLIAGEHEGVSAARNKGLEAATGEIIAYLDSDNIWTPHYLRTMITFMLGRNLDCAYAGQRINGDDGVATRYRGDQFDWGFCLAENYIDLNSFMHRSYLYKRLAGFDRALRRMNDWDLILRYTKNHSVQYAPFVGCEYFDRQNLSNRITKLEPIAYRYKVIENHLINWKNVEASVAQRDSALVSIVIPAYKNDHLTTACVESILKYAGDYRLEIIIINNAGSESNIAALEALSTTKCQISCVSPPTNLMFSLANNFGVSLSRGKYLIFLNNDTAVTEGWLNPLIGTLANSQDVGAVGPKLLYPDQTIQHCGVVFNSKSMMPYHVYQEFHAEHFAVNRIREFQAITAACVAMRAADFVALRGFDALYINGCEDLDLCFRLREQLNKKCIYNPKSIVYHHEGSSEGRGEHIPQNRRLFVDRWRTKIVADDQAIYAFDGFQVADYERKDAQPDADLIRYLPVLLKGSKLRSIKRPDHLTFSIKAPVPSAKVVLEWGDYHFGLALADALRGLGHSARLDLMPDWYQAEEADVTIVLRGLTQYRVSSSSINLMWNISHPDKISAAEYNLYDHVFVASISYAQVLDSQLTVPVSALLQCTDRSRFGAPITESEIRECDPELLFVGNSRNQFRQIVKDALEAGLAPAIYGTLWERFIDVKYIAGQHISNADLPRVYRRAGIVLNDHWPSMGAHGFLSNRLFDAGAAGACILSDSAAGLQDVFGDLISIYEKKDDLAALVDRLLKSPDDRVQRAKKLRELVLSEHTFDHRALEIVETVKRILVKETRIRDRAS